MKNIKTILIAGLLAISTYAGNTSPPIEATETYDSTNWAGGDVESNPNIYGYWTGVQLFDVTGKYIHREGSSITGENQYGLYMHNSATSFLLIENYGNITSTNYTGVNMVGIFGQLNNKIGGQVFGGTTGVVIDSEVGTSIFPGFGIYNQGRIESTGIGIYRINDNQELYINNASTGFIHGDNYGMLIKGNTEIINDGIIDSYYEAGIYFLDGGTVVNNGVIRSIDDRLTSFVYPNFSIKSYGNVTLKGNGQYVGNIKYMGTDLTSTITLEETNINFKNARLEDWNFITINGGENYFNVEYNKQQNNDLFPYVIMQNGAILHTGGETNANFYIDNGVLNPYENNYDVDHFYWDRYAQQNEGGPKYYEKREFEKLTMNNLTVGAQGAVKIDFKISQPLTPDALGTPEMSTNNEGHNNFSHEYVGYGYGGFVSYGLPFAKFHYQRINFDQIEVKGASYFTEGSTLYLVDHTYESPEENVFTANYNYSINVFEGNISFDDFSNIEFYSGVVGIDHFNNETGTLYLSLNNYQTGQKNLIDWWLKEISTAWDSLDFPDAPTAVSTTAVSTVATTAAIVEPESALLPYEVTQTYNTNISDLTASTELQQIIYSFTEWADIDLFMDSINKLEYASLAASNLNIINTRVNSMYNRLGNYNGLTDNTGLDIWVDYYMTDGNLKGKSNHDISGRGFEVSAGINKSITDNIVLGLSVNHTDYTSTVNDSGVHTDIVSEGYGVNVFGLWQQTASLKHKFIAGMTNYNNTDEIVDFNSTEMFSSYRAEYLFKINKLSITPLAGFRFASVKYNDSMIDAENGLQGFTHNSLESELGVRVARQFKKLNVNVSGSWMHEMLDRSNTSTAYTSFGDFEQTGIERDSDSFELGFGVQYQFNDKVMLDIDYTRELSSNSDNSGLEAKLTFRF